MKGFPERKCTFKKKKKSLKTHLAVYIPERKWPVQYSFHVSVGPVELYIWLTLESPVSYVWFTLSCWVSWQKSVIPQLE